MPNRSRVIPFPGLEHELAPILRVDGLSLTRGGRPVLREIDLSLTPYGITVLMGPNGAGKSLLLRAIAGLMPVDSGAVFTAPGAGPAALVFQKPVLLKRSVKANLRHALRLARVPRRDRQPRLDELIVMAGLTDQAAAPARTLSGGEQQRLAIVRALAASPKLLLLDEPTSSLDPAATAEIEELIARTADDGVKVVLVTHDRAQAARMADDVAFLHSGRVQEHGPAHAFFARPQSAEARAYMDGLLFV